MAAGRPRTVSLPPDDMIKLGKEMVDWVKIHIKDIYHLSEWYTVEKKFTYNQWKQFITKDEFHPYYEQALKIVAKKYLDGTVNPTISSRWQRVYFEDVRESEDKDLDRKLDKELEKEKRKIEHEIKLKQEALQTVSPFQNDLDKDDIIYKLQAENALLKKQMASDAS